MDAAAVVEDLLRRVACGDELLDHVRRRRALGPVAEEDGRPRAVERAEAVDGLRVVEVRRAGDRPGRVEVRPPRVDHGQPGLEVLDQLELADRADAGRRLHRPDPTPGRVDLDEAWLALIAGHFE